MYQNKTIAVVVPAHNESKMIHLVVEGMPDFVDRIVIVDDKSTDNTVEVIKKLEVDHPRIHLIEHKDNQGVGGAIRTGYIWARDNDIDATAVMAGDNQMHPDDLPALLQPIVDDTADYTKGNRLITGEAWKKIPRIRYLGNAALSFLTKIVSGYWHIADSQSGYTVINSRSLNRIPLEEIYPRYGVPNDILVTLNIHSLRVKDVPIQPIYASEVSELKIHKVIFSISWLMLKLFFKRMFHKYIIRDFHPLILFYFLGIALLILSVVLFIIVLYVWATVGDIPDISFLAFLLCFISGLQLTLFAMLFDMQYNEDLKA